MAHLLEISRHTHACTHTHTQTYSTTEHRDTADFFTIHPPPHFTHTHTHTPYRTLEAQLDSEKQQTVADLVASEKVIEVCDQIYDVFG